MRSITRTTLVVGFSVAVAAGLAMPASAADTITTVEVAATGGIAITAPANADALEVTPGFDAEAGILGVEVTDNRSAKVDWAASIALTDFVGGATAAVIPASAAEYTPTTAVVVGTATVASSTATNPVEVRTVQTATGVSGNNTATWDAALTIPVPASALADTYVATLTHSVL
ncbi:hypothetical protein [Rhodococcus sp. ARC_M6]|uniref:hypothetical protein n=1 Tax=Rhodococcus sp. ARC_M6 TaxID=2928852 RepID=UPI001FB399B7|nr:hypothetical protein [Rhodococcus sp. ARC_M6]MCJ0901925.1 hypothetical protein [Rhodococcus sp. ARC_M6]